MLGSSRCSGIATADGMVHACVPMSSERSGLHAHASVGMAPGKVIVGQRYMVERLVIGLLSNRHVLLEGVPGLAKSLTVTILSQAIRAPLPHA